MTAVAKFKNKQFGRAGTGESAISFSEMKEEQKEKGAAEDEMVR